MVGEYLLILLSCSQIFPSYCNDDERDIYSTLTETNTWPQDSDVDAVIEDLNIINVSADSLTISWKVNGANVTSYTITWFKDNKQINSVIEEFLPDCKYKIDKLEPCTEYAVKVEPKVTNGIGKENTISGTTSKIQPGAPTIIEAIPDENNNDVPSLKILWNEPNVGLTCVKHYRVHVNTKVHGIEYQNFVISLKSYIIIDHDLLPCASYFVTVVAIGADGGNGLPSSIFLSKPTSPFPVIPRLVNSVNVPAVVATATTVAFNWNVLNVRNNCSIDVLFTSCQFLYSEGYGFEIEDYGITNYTNNGKEVDIVRLVVENLSPVSRYLCSGWTAAASVPVPVFTKELAPSPPLNFHIIDELNTTFAWNPAKLMPGRLQKYRMTFYRKPLYPVPDACSTSNILEEFNIKASYLNYTWPNGVGYSNYTAYIQAQTGGGWSSVSNKVTFISSEIGVPDKVTNLIEVTKPLENDSNVLDTNLYWNLPCSLKGQLKHFEISVYGENFRLNNESYTANYSFTKQLETGSDVDKNELFSINLGELKPDYSYRFKVSAVISGTNEKGTPASWYTDYPPGIPPQPTADYLKSITLKPNKIRKTTTSFEILLPLFPDANGEIIYYAIIVYRLGYDYKPAHTRFNLEENFWPNESSWRESMERDFQIPYQASEPLWTPYPNYILDYGSIKAVKFVIGDDNTCRDVSLTTKRRLYCNGPLKPGTSYEVRMRAFTNGGYADAPAVTIRTDAETSVILIVGVVFGIMLIGMLLTILVAGKLDFKRKKQNSKSGENNCQDRGRARRGTMTSQSRAYDTVMRTRRR